MKSIGQKVVLTTAVMALEGCWLYTLVYILDVLIAKGRLNVPGLLPLYLLAFGTNWLWRRLGWPRVIRGALNIIGGVVFTLLAVKIQLFGHLPLADAMWLAALGEAFTNIFYGLSPEMVLLVSGGVIWWFGQRMASLPMAFATAVREFQFGLIVLLILLFITYGMEIQLSHTILVVTTFFAASLLSLSIAHAQENKQPTEFYHGNWLGILLMSISAIILLGLAIGSVITPDLLRLVVVGLTWMWGLIVKGIVFIVNLFPQPDFIPGEALPGAGPMPVQEPDYSKFLVLPEVVRKGLRFGWSVLMIGFLLVFLWRISEQIFTWLRTKFGATGNAEYESLSGAFWVDIQSLFQRIFLWVLKVLKWPALLRKQKRAEPKEITSIRQLYQQLLRWAAKAGLPKPGFQTAYEYLDVLQEKMPAYRDTLQYVTGKYVSARYGHVTPSVEELDQLKQSWHHLKRQHLK
ncbi:MAG: DUF4129 domain-containing protein [Dehalococcoidales bacterium]